MQVYSLTGYIIVIDIQLFRWLLITGGYFIYVIHTVVFINSFTTGSRTVRLKPELLQDYDPRKALLQPMPGLFQDHEPRKAEVVHLKSGLFQDHEPRLQPHNKTHRS